MLADIEDVKSEAITEFSHGRPKDSVVEVAFYELSILSLLSRASQRSEPPLDETAGVPNWIAAGRHGILPAVLTRRSSP
jgi:hypothetical protein